MTDTTKQESPAETVARLRAELAEAEKAAAEAATKKTRGQEVAEKLLVKDAGYICIGSAVFSPLTRRSFDLAVKHVAQAIDTEIAAAQRRQREACAVAVQRFPEHGFISVSCDRDRHLIDCAEAVFAIRNAIPEPTQDGKEALPGCQPGSSPNV